MSHHLKLVVGSITAVICLAAFQSPAARFETIEKSGINSSLNPAKTPEKHLIETMAGGVALIDADGDGLLDVFLANGAPQPKLHKTGPTWSNRLYRNKGNLEFEDVTDKSGLHGLGFDIGTAAADYDNDGDTDLFVTGVRGNTLFRNEGALKFADVTRQAKLGQDDVPAHQRWSVGAGWFDFDRDGWLDLFVVRYVQWLPEREPFCGDQQKGYRSYCHPKHYEGLPNALYRNNRDGTFTDISSASGVAAHVGKGMGVAFADMDADLDIDVLVTNDTVPNFLFRNEGNGKFSQVGMQSGIALNDDGRALSSMGADFRDINNDGQEDIFITALSNETFPLYQNSAKGFFLDVTYPSRLGTLTLPWSGWGTGIFDFNNDGWKDIFCANGDVQDNTEMFSNRASQQPNLLLLNDSRGVFSAAKVGRPAWHRGAAFGDLDNSGTIDVVVARLNQSPLVLKGVGNAQANWIGFDLQGVTSNKSALGALVRINTSQGSQWNRVTTAVGYASSSDRRVHFGLGSVKQVISAEVRWPSGTVQSLTGVQAGRYNKVVEPRSDQSR